MSLLTYGAIGITTIVLAVVTIFDKEGGEEMASVVEPEVTPIASSNELFSDNQEEPTTGLFSNTESQGFQEPIVEASETSQAPIEESSGSPEEELGEEELGEEEIGEKELGEDEIGEDELENKEKGEKLMGGKKRKQKNKTKNRRNKKQRKTRSK